jgi:hypothetical protein
MNTSGLILGYHGCEGVLTQQIVVGESELKASMNGHDWLGQGIYFWAHDPLRAAEWAADRRFRQLTEPGVVGAVIDLGRCLNLAERELPSNG